MSLKDKAWDEREDYWLQESFINYNTIALEVIGNIYENKELLK